MNKILKYSLLTTLTLSLTGIIGGGLYVSHVLKNTPQIEESMLRSSSTSNMYDSDGNLIWSNTNNKRDYININDVPDMYKNILLATEDGDFYNSHGYSLKGIANAAISTIGEKFGGDKARGGSTIEQQLIKNTVFSTKDKDRTINRKIKEIWLASQMDKNFSKDQILEFYINKINLGENSYGVNTISLTYFGKPISDFKEESIDNLSKLAILAGLGQAPSTYNLYDNPSAVEQRRNVVLEAAKIHGVLTEDQVNQIKQVPVTKDLQKRFWRNPMDQVSKHSAYVSATLNQIKELGYDLERTPMQIYTNLDSKIDAYLNDYINSFKGYQDDEQQIATTIIDNNSGKVIAQNGGRNLEAYGLNRAINKNRSSGSTTKPFIAYGPALEYKNVATNLRLDSSPYKYPGTNVIATNYGGFTYGVVDMTTALRLSLNTPAIRTLDTIVGSQNAKKFLSGIGMDVKDNYGGADALGINVSTEQIANAFSTLSSMGEYQKAAYVKKIVFEDNSEKELYYGKTKAMHPSVAYSLLKMLETVPKQNGTATNAILPYQGYAVKTGTVGYADLTNKPNLAASDVWIAGTTKNYAIALWSGYDQPNLPHHWIDKDYKGHQEIFRHLMQYLNNGKDTSDWQMPSGVANLGGGFYHPIDTGYAQYSKPLIAEINWKFSNNIDNYKVKNDDENVVKKLDKEKEQVSSFEKSISDDDKKLLEKNNDRIYDKN